MKYVCIPEDAIDACQDLGKSSLEVYVGLERTRMTVLGDSEQKRYRWFTATHHMISQRTSCGVRTIQRCLAMMEEAELVEIERASIRERGGTIKNEPNSYRLKERINT